MEAKLTADDLHGSLKVMQRLNEKAELNQQDKYGMLRNEIMENTELA